MNLKEKIERVIKWSIATFSDLTLKDQLNKFNEELLEFDQAKTRLERVKELADCYIVAMIMARFDEKISINHLELCQNLRHSEQIPIAEMSRAINRKMFINERRSWKKVNNVWKHI